MNYYEEFGISPNATTEEVRQAHRALARLLHPDHFQDDHLRRLAERQMKRINGIYAILSNAELRSRYDLELQRPAEGMPAGAPAPKKLPWVVAGAAITACVALWLRAGGERVVVVELPAPSRTVASHATQAQVKRPSGRRERTPADAGPKTPPGAQAAAEPEATGEPWQDERVREGAVAREQGGERPYARPAPPVSGPPPVPATVTPPASGLTGRWVFIPSAAGASRQPYSAEYAELVLDEFHQTVRGSYRAKYRVADQALSPNVQFQFEGRSGAGRFPWRGNGGASGLVHIELKKENLLAVSWYTTAPGEPASLMSGTAVLVRAAE